MLIGDPTDIGGYTTTPVTFGSGVSADQTLTINITHDAIIEGTDVLTFEIQDVSGGNSASVGFQIPSLSYLYLKHIVGTTMTQLL